jgi:hypothetical protein
MLGGLESLLNAVRDVPYLLAGLVVESINGWIGAIAFLGSALVAALPAFPAVPTVPEAPAAALSWLVPVGAVMAVFTVMLTLWLTFMGLKIALNWAKVRM